MSHTANLLRQGVADLGMALPDKAMQQLGDYLALLTKWNRVYNLTAIHDEPRLVSHHILDSLAVVRFLPEGNLVDVGSGAGLPGLPIAISHPGRAVTLLDSNQKKCAFLRQAVAELGLARVDVVTQRVDEYRPPQKFQTVISRAFSDLGDFVKLAGHLCSPDGVMIAMKGLRPDAEIDQVASPWAVQRMERLEVPQLEAARHLVFLHASSTHRSA